MSSSHKATLLDGASNTLKTSVELASEKGASNWLTVLPLQEYSITLHKTAFHDAVALRYGWDPVRLPQYCACGTKFSVEHAFTCPKGGFPSIRRNEIHDLMAGLLTEVCHEVEAEPHLQPVTGEKFILTSSNIEDGARLDISANTCFIFTLLMFSVNGLGVGGTVTGSMRVKNFYIKIGFLTVTSPKTILSHWENGC